jgi:diguanylate cyclase (GGDEF)-like protein/PAS domain S-box-containing protein
VSTGAALLQRLLDDSARPQALVARDGACVHANPAFLAALGLAPGAAVDPGAWFDRASLSAVLAGSGAQPAPVELLPSAAHGRAPAFEAIRVEHEGAPHVLLRAAADPSERARCERDLFFALAPDLVALLDAGGRLGETNPAWTVSLGWEHAQLAGMALAELAHEDDRERLEGALRTAASGADVLRARLRSRFGGWRWFEWTLSAFDDGRLYATARDVTAQVRTREALLRHRDELEARIAERTAELDAALARLRLHADNSPLATIEWDAALRVSYWSRRAREMTGWTAEEAQGRTPHELPLFDEGQSQGFQVAMARLLGREAPRQSHVQRVRTRDGRELACEWFDSAVYGPDGQVASILSLVQDVTAREAARAALADSEERFRLAFEQTAVGMAHVALDGRWLRMNHRLAQMLGFDSAPADGHLLDLVHPEDRAADAAALARLLDGRIDASSLEKRLLRVDGSAFWAQQHISLRREPDGSAAHFIVVVEDVDARVSAEHALKAAHEQLEAKVAERTRELERLMAVLEDQARQDPLTGLPNRRGLMDRLPRSIARSGRQRGSVVLMFVDLDRFKHVNDTLGHEAGDALLRETAVRLLGAVRKTDIVARLGGDEFVVVLENVREPALQARRVAEKIRMALRVPLALDGTTVSLSASIGVVIHEDGVVTPETLIARADGGMYVAKRGGGDAVQVHAEDGADAPEATPG